MNFKRMAMLVLVGAPLVTWLASAATSGTRDVVEPLKATAPAIDVRGDALAAEIAKLHERLRPSTAPRQPGRDLFSFAARQAPPAPPPGIEARPALSEAAPARPAAPAWKLSGIAEDAVEGGLVRTAIITGTGQLFLVKEGETVTARYQVSKISADVVELTDLTGGAPLRLALK